MYIQYASRHTLYVGCCARLYCTTSSTCRCTLWFIYVHLLFFDNTPHPNASWWHDKYLAMIISLLNKHRFNHIFYKRETKSTIQNDGTVRCSNSKTPTACSAPHQHFISDVMDRAPPTCDDCERRRSIHCKISGCLLLLWFHDKESSIATHIQRIVKSK